MHFILLLQNVMCLCICKIDQHCGPESLLATTAVIEMTADHLCHTLSISLIYGSFAKNIFRFRHVSCYSFVFQKFDFLSLQKLLEPKAKLMLKQS